MERLAKKEFLLISVGLLEMTINVNKDLKQRERIKMFAEHLLSIPVNSLRCFHMLPHMIETRVLMLNGVNSGVTTLILKFQGLLIAIWSSDAFSICIPYCIWKIEINYLLYSITVTINEILHIKYLELHSACKYRWSWWWWQWPHFIFKSPWYLTSCPGCRELEH